jgi:hypothetical protein
VSTHSYFSKRRPRDSSRLFIQLDLHSLNCVVNIKYYIHPRATLLTVICKLDLHENATLSLEEDRTSGLWLYTTLNEYLKLFSPIGFSTHGQK